ncbi:MAG: nitroreductase family protein [Desulfobacterales bacterium]
MSTAYLIQANRAAIVKDVLLNRRSVRQFQNQPLKREHLNDIIEAAIYAPSGSNTQNQRFLVIEDKNELRALGNIRFIWPYPTSGNIREKKSYGLIGDAAAAILVFADAALTDARDIGEYYIWESLEIQNCAASIENMLNMAAAHGVGSCWLSASEKMTRTRLLSGHTWVKALAPYYIPETYKIQGIVILGYPRGGLNEAGFPKGEKEHGATFWRETKRKEISHYLVQKRSFAPDVCIHISWQDRLILKASSKIIKLLLLIVRIFERRVYSIEINHALADIIEKKAKEQ